MLTIFHAPKMSDRVDALEEHLTAMEASMRQLFVEFCQFMLEEFARLHMAHKEKRRGSLFSKTETLLEDRMTTKKVELLLFNETDPVG